MADFDSNDLSDSEFDDSEDVIMMDSEEEETSTPRKSKADTLGMLRRKVEERQERQRLRSELSYYDEYAF